MLLLLQKQKEEEHYNIIVLYKYVIVQNTVVSGKTTMSNIAIDHELQKGDGELSAIVLRKKSS
jgi:hypothetical protein